MNLLKLPFKVPMLFIWVGFVSAISFMEAWLKFTAPGVTLTTGLAIGQVIFGALNKVELCIAFLIAGLIVLDESWRLSTGWLFIFALSILLVQTFYMLPVLSSRVDVFLLGEVPAASHMHVVYVLLEVIKVTILTIYGLTELKNGNTSNADQH